MRARCVDAEVGDVGESLSNAGKVADAVAVRILERAGIDPIGHRPTPPVAHVSLPVCLQTVADRRTLSKRARQITVSASSTTARPPSLTVTCRCCTVTVWSPARSPKGRGRQEKCSRSPYTSRAASAETPGAARRCTAKAWVPHSRSIHMPSQQEQGFASDQNAFGMTPNVKKDDGNAGRGGGERLEGCLRNVHPGDGGNGQHAINNATFANRLNPVTGERLPFEAVASSGRRLTPKNLGRDTWPPPRSATSPGTHARFLPQPEPILQVRHGHSCASGRRGGSACRGLQLVSHGRRLVCPRARTSSTTGATSCDLVLGGHSAMDARRIAHELFREHLEAGGTPPTSALRVIWTKNAMSWPSRTRATGAVGGFHSR